MMSLMRDEIGQNMPYVKRQVAPHVSLRGWYATTMTATQLEEGGDAATTPLEGRAELPARDPPVIHSRRRDDPMFLAQSPDPIAPCVVEVGANRSDRAAWDPWHGRGPVHSRDVLDEVRSDAAAGSPRSQDGVLQIKRWIHGVRLQGRADA
jgi:hypothetical protein